MHLLFSVSALVAALAARALAQDLDPDPNFDAITRPGLNEAVVAGTTYTIEWTVPPTAPSGPVTITLLGGPNQGGLDPVATVVKSIDNALSKYDWPVDKSLGTHPLYGLRIALDADASKFQYSTPFHITGANPGANVTSTAAPSGSSSSSSSATRQESTTSADASSTTSPSATTTETEEPAPSESGSGNGTQTSPVPKTVPGSGAGRVVAAGLLGGLVAFAAIVL